MFSYKDVLENSLVKEIFAKIDQNDQARMCSHGSRHTLSCINIAKNLFKEFKINPIYQQETLIACSLHDIGNLGGKRNHAKRSYKFSKIFLKDKLNKQSRKRVIKAIKHHSKIRKNASIIERVLVCADKLDSSKTRMMPNGKLYVGMRQTANIEQIKTSQILDTFLVEFFVNKEFDLIEWNNYYFTKKIIASINNLAKYLGLKAKIEYKKA